jgi:phage FluMu protein Com
MSANQTSEQKDLHEDISHEKRKMLSCHVDEKIHYSASALTQLQEELAELYKRCQHLAEQKLNQEHNTVKSKVQQGVQLLEVMAQNINALVAEIEAEILTFKEIAIEVNRCYHLLQQPSGIKQESFEQPKKHHCKTLNIWEVHAPSVPTVVRRGAKFIVTSRKINMFNTKDENDTQIRAEIAQERRQNLEKWLIEKNSVF